MKSRQTLGLLLMGFDFVLVMFVSSMPQKFGISGAFSPIVLMIFGIGLYLFVTGDK